MDFRQLEYIVAIAENKSISKAAETLFISQSGLNQQLIKLEKELGLQLFDRNKHFLRPTKAGEIYVKNAIEILKIKRNTYTELGDLWWPVACQRDWPARLPDGFSVRPGSGLLQTV